MNLINNIEKLCSIHAPSGFESMLIEYLIGWFANFIPNAVIDKTINNTLLIIKGQPKVVFIAHADSVGFILQYNNKLLALGSPEVFEKTKLRTIDNFEVDIESDQDENYYLKSNKTFERGTTFTFIPHFIEYENTIQSPYLDNRVGIALLMQLALESEHFCIVISSNEESCGGSIEKTSRILYEKYEICKSVIVDTTFHTEGIRMGDGVVLSLKDKYLPSERWVSVVKNILQKNNIPYQLEVEDVGSSDGAYIHKSPYPIDWCFLGIACLNNHSEKEIVNIDDLNYLYDAINYINKINMFNL
ncbi:MAG: hypothetical protein GYA62_00565 [Bacteroidales bacterium]|nr:hypothetical protein [Bacteroidales bacterium]